MTKEPTQIGAFPGRDAPPGSIMPPTAAVMENVTYQDVGPEIVKLAEALIARSPEFQDLRGIDFGVVWSRNQGRSFGGEPLYAWPVVSGLLEQHFAEGKLPEFSLVLSYKAVDALRSEGQYLHPQILERHLHIALMMLEASEGRVLKTRGATVQAFPETVGRYGLQTKGERLLSNQIAMFAEHDAAGQTRAARGSRSGPSPAAAGGDTGGDDEGAEPGAEAE